MKKVQMSIRAYFPDGGACTHRVELAWSDLRKWIEAYQFTHADVVSVTIKIYMEDIKK